jgi:hypothetical protein
MPCNNTLTRSARCSVHASAQMCLDDFHLEADASSRSAPISMARDAGFRGLSESIGRHLCKNCHATLKQRQILYAGPLQRHSSIINRTQHPVIYPSALAKPCFYVHACTLSTATGLAAYFDLTGQEARRFLSAIMMTPNLAQKDGFARTRRRRCIGRTLSYLRLLASHVEPSASHPNHVHLLGHDADDPSPPTS